MKIKTRVLYKTPLEEKYCTLTRYGEEDPHARYVFRLTSNGNALFANSLKTVDTAVNAANDSEAIDWAVDEWRRVCGDKGDALNESVAEINPRSDFRQRREGETDKQWRDRADASKTIYKRKGEGLKFAEPCKPQPYEVK